MSEATPFIKECISEACNQIKEGEKFYVQNWNELEPANKGMRLHRKMNPIYLVPQEAVRCGQCKNCQRLTGLQKLCTPNPPFSHASDDSVRMWNTMLHLLGCDQWPNNYYGKEPTPCSTAQPQS